MPAAIDNKARSRFEITVDGELAELVYRHDGKRFVLVHTGVPEVLAGRGIGGALVSAAVDAAAVGGLTIVPDCPFVRSWLRKNPDDAGRAAVDWSDG